MWIATVFILMTLALSNGILAQGLVLKHIHSSTTHQQIFAAQYLDVPNSVVRYNSWDFDGDGQQDYVAQEHEIGGGPFWILKIYSGVGFNLLWSSEGQIPPRTNWGSPIFIDFTGDGIKELIYYDTDVSHLMIYSVLLHTEILSMPFSSDYLILDFDADGILDIGLYSSIAPEEYRYEIWGAGVVTSSPPGNLVILPDGDNLELSWQQVDSCSMYRVYWAFSLGGEYASVGTSAIPFFTHPGATIAPAAFYRVTAITSTNGEQVIAQAFYENAKRRVNPKNLTK